MQNARVPAAAEGVPANPTADPCLNFINEWNRVSAALAAMQGDGSTFYETVIAPYETAAKEGKIPPATTAEGAAAALNKAISFGDLEGQDESLVRAALAFLEAPAKPETAPADDREFESTLNDTANLLDLAGWLALNTMRRVEEDNGRHSYTIPGGEADQILSLIFMLRDTTRRVANGGAR